MSLNMRQSAGFWKRTPAHTPSVVAASFGDDGSSSSGSMRDEADSAFDIPRSLSTAMPATAAAAATEKTKKTLLETQTAAAEQQTHSSPADQADRTEEQPSAATADPTETKFAHVLSSANTDLGQLRKLSWKGIPASHRATAWRILMGYAPLSLARRQPTLQRKRKEYMDLRDQTFSRGTSALDAKLWHQITIDVPRTAPDLPLFRNALVQRSLERLLYCWAARHPASGYVQGINDLATPFYHVFLAEHPRDALDSVLDDVEADGFWCLTRLLDSIHDNYTHAQPGIQRALVKMRSLVARIDGRLADHLAGEGVEFLQFAFRWVNCLLVREVTLDCCVRMWDTYLAEEDQGFARFHIYVCAALLLKWSKQLMLMDFAQIMVFLQRPPSLMWDHKDVEVLLAEAYMYKCLYDESPSHYAGDRP
ncbi:GTPase-activating protein [Coemansia erecta]|uniref:GTPase-activating protein n=1 Tax=Coemansia erecta TaxID=147472 RepID=A0A9W7Y1Q0_9FUNG|nr:GTPase-activating protein [Coemansia erecta]